MRFLIYLSKIVCASCLFVFHKCLLNARLKFLKPFYTHGAVVVEARFKYVKVAAVSAHFSKVFSSHKIKKKCCCMFYLTMERNRMVKYSFRFM